MRSISELLVRIADLAEAEGKLLRASVMRLASGLALFVVAIVAALAGFGFLLASIFLATSSQAGYPIGALVSGFVAVALAGGLAWTGKRMGS